MPGTLGMPEQRDAAEQGGEDNAYDAAGFSDETSSTTMCRRCRDKHRKCDRQVPSCKRCERAGEPCFYPKRALQLSGESVDTILGQITRLKSSLQEFEDCFKAFTTPSKSVGSVSEECASQQTFAYDAMTGHLIVPSLNSSRHTNESIQEVSAVFVAQEPHSSMEHNYDLRITQASAGLRILHNFDSNATFLEYLMYTLRREPAPSLQEYYEDMVDSDYKSKIRRDEDRRVVSMMVFKKGSKVQSKSVSGANSLVWPDEAYLYVAEPFMPNPLSTVDAPGDEESEAAQMVNPSTHGLHRNDASVCEDSEKSKQTPCMRVFAVPDNEPLIVNHLVLQYSRCFESLHVHFPSLMRKFWTGSLSPILINSICAMYALHTYVTHRAEAPPTDNNTISDQAHRTWEFGHRVEQHFLRKTRVFLEDAFDVPHIDTVSALLNLSHCYLKYTRGDTPDYTAYVNAGASDMISKRTDKSRLYLSMAVAMIRSLCVYDQHGRMVDINLEDTADTFEREDAHRLFWSVVTMDAALNADPYKDSAWTILNDCFDDRVRIPSPTVMPDEGEEASMAIARFWYARRIGRDGFAMHRRIAIDLFQRISTAAGGMWGTEITQLVDMIIQELDDYDKVRPPMLRSWPNRKYERPECLIHVVLTDLDMMMKKMMLLQGYFGESDDLLKELTSKMYSTHTRIKRAQKSTSANTSSTSNTNLDISSSTTKTTDLSRTDADATFPTFLKKKLYWGAMPEQPIPSHSACHANRIQGSISEQDIKNAVAQGRFIDIALQICFDVAQHFSEVIAKLACFRSSIILNMIQCVGVLIRYLELLHQVSISRLSRKVNNVRPATSSNMSPIFLPLLISLVNGRPVSFNNIGYTDKPRAVTIVLGDVRRSFASLCNSLLYGDYADTVVQQIDSILATPLQSASLASLANDIVGNWQSRCDDAYSMPPSLWMNEHPDVVEGAH